MLELLLKEIIISNRNMILNLSINPREFYLEPLANHVIVGSRRAGKTYILYQYIQKVFHTKELQHRFVFINFEDDRLLEFNHTHFQLILDVYNELYNDKPVFFLDEVQNIEHWEKFARRLADNGYQVFITGSNAQMLSAEIGSTLGGRFLVHEVYPLTFSEYLTFNNVSLTKTSFFGNEKIIIKKHFQEYFQYGGFPELLKYEDKRTYLSNLFQKLLYGDIMVRYGLQNDKVMHLLIKKMAESVNSETSINRIKNLIKSIGFPIGIATIFNYLDYLNKAYLMVPVENYIHKFVEKETIKKYYFIDNGILMLFLHNQPTKLLENLVFLHLKKQYEQIYFYKRNYEIDFYLPELEMIVQVSYNIDDIETEKRELQSIEKSMKEIPTKSIVIITYDTEKTLELPNHKVQVIPVWKWILEPIKTIKTII